MSRRPPEAGQSLASEAAESLEARTCRDRAARRHYTIPPHYSISRLTERERGAMLILQLIHLGGGNPVHAPQLRLACAPIEHQSGDTIESRAHGTALEGHPVL